MSAMNENRANIIIWLRRWTFANIVVIGFYTAYIEKAFNTDRLITCFKALFMWSEKKVLLKNYFASNIFPLF